MDRLQFETLKTSTNDRTNPFHDTQAIIRLLLSLNPLYNWQINECSLKHLSVEGIKLKFVSSGCVVCWW